MSAGSSGPGEGKQEEVDCGPSPMTSTDPGWGRDWWSWMWSQPGKEPVWNLVGWWPVVWENGAGQAAQTSLWVETATREGTDGQGQAPVSGIGSRLGRAGHPRERGRLRARSRHGRPCAHSRVMGSAARLSEPPATWLPGQNCLRTG